MEWLALGDKLAVSHASCLGQMEPGEIKRIGGRLAEAGVTILTGPAPCREAARTHLYKRGKRIAQLGLPRL